MYALSAQYCDAQDLSVYLRPIISLTGVASFAAFVASSAIASKFPDIRNQVSLFGGVCGVLATTITAFRNSVKFDVKVRVHAGRSQVAHEASLQAYRGVLACLFSQAEMFRGAAGQYRLMATRLEERIRQHRMAMMDESWKAQTIRDEETAAFNLVRPLDDGATNKLGWCLVWGTRLFIFRAFLR